MATKKVVAIGVEGVSKYFRLPHEKQGSIKSIFLNIFKGSRTYEKQDVLKDISFEIHKGEFFGIVGRNGSGKSTLLKILAGIYSPSKGSITINGNLTPFIELGVGFNPELTGRENVFLNGALLGFNRKEMLGMYEDIVHFAELEKFMDQKLKNYSSGMQVRLAFSIAIKSKSEILVFDEVLAVGDSSFQRKCLDVFRDLKIQGKTIVLVSHDMTNIERFCDRALVISEGKILMIGEPHGAASTYARLNIDNSESSVQVSKKNRWGTGKLHIKEVKILSQGKQTKIIESGEDLAFHFKVEKSKGLEKLPVVCGVAIFNDDNVSIMGPNSAKANLDPTASKYVLTIPSFNFAPGRYRITFVLYDDTLTTPYDVMDRWAEVTVVSDHIFHGLVETEHNWKTL